jgi:sterol carrier protein 2
MAKDLQPCYVLGVGMTKFIKPRGKVDYTELGFEAGVKALLDAHINYDDVEHAVACYCYGDSTCGQRVLYQLGMTEIPIYNVNNNCSTGSTGLYMARNMISHGQADCVLVVGFEKMSPGSLQSAWQDRAGPTMTSMLVMSETRGIEASPGAAQLFGNAGREYIEKYSSLFCYILETDRGEQARRDKGRLRRDRARQPRPLRQQPVLAVPGRVHARPDPRRADHPRAADQAAMLPDL